MTNRWFARIRRFPAYRATSSANLTRQVERVNRRNDRSRPEFSKVSNDYYRRIGHQLAE
jgi:hypothetical protein